MGLDGMDAPGGGALVNQVFPFTAAERAGIRIGDVLLEFNGEKVDTLQSLFQLARGTGEGAPVSLRVRRAGSEFYLGLQLGRHPLFN
jgi:serine protease Do